MAYNLKKFANENEYDTYINNDPFLPNVSLIGVDDVRYNPYGYSRDYLTFNILSDGAISWHATSISSSNIKTISYSKDDGETWTEITSNTGNLSTIDVVNGDIILFKGENERYLNSSFSGTTCRFEVEGNAMSLIYGDNFRNQTEFPTGTTDNLNRLFQDCTGLTSSKNLVLPVTTLTNYCYFGMFNGCISLETAPKLPAITLAYGCYTYMFVGCISLVNAPELPATTLADECYHWRMLLNYLQLY